MLKADFKQILRESLFDEEGQAENAEMIDMIAGRLFEAVVDWLPKYIVDCTVRIMQILDEEKPTTRTEQPIIQSGVSGVCPDCGGTLMQIEGCTTCHSCGYSKC